MPEELLQNHPLLELGQRAVRNDDAAEPPELSKFNDAIAQYSLSRSAKWEEVLALATAVAAKRLDLKVYGYLALAAFHSERELERALSAFAEMWVERRAGEISEDDLERLGLK